MSGMRQRQCLLLIHGDKVPIHGVGCRSGGQLRFGTLCSLCSRRLRCCYPLPQAELLLLLLELLLLELMLLLLLLLSLLLVLRLADCRDSCRTVLRCCCCCWRCRRRSSSICGRGGLQLRAAVR